MIPFLGDAGRTFRIDMVASNLLGLVAHQFTEPERGRNITGQFGASMATIIRKHSLEHHPKHQTAVRNLQICNHHADKPTEHQRVLMVYIAKLWAP